MAEQPVGAVEIDANRLDKESCQEVLHEALDLVKTQVGATDSLSTKLAGVLGQATTLALAAFGAATLAVPDGSSQPRWLPIWGGIGLATAGAGWAIAGIEAVRGLAPQEWQIGFSPGKLWIPEVLTPAATAEAFTFIAAETQQIIDHNARTNAALARRLYRAQTVLVAALVAGVLVAATAYFGRLLAAG
jgi:hypothetical protein